MFIFIKREKSTLHTCYLVLDYAKCCDKWYKLHLLESRNLNLNENIFIFVQREKSALYTFYPLLELTLFSSLGFNSFSTRRVRGLAMVTSVSSSENLKNNRLEIRQSKRILEDKLNVSQTVAIHSRHDSHSISTRGTRKIEGSLAGSGDLSLTSTCRTLYSCGC